MSENLPDRLPQTSDSVGSVFRQPAPRTYRVEGIVLRVIPYGEKDRILTIYTRQMGKLNAIAKGSRNPLTRLAPATQLFTHAHYFLAQGKTLEVVTQVRIIEVFERLRKDVEMMVVCAQCCEMLSKSVPDGEADPALFDDLLSALRIANKGVDADLLLAAFISRLLKRLGYMPQVSFCVGCGSRILDDEVHLSIAQGGTLCKDCANRKGFDVKLSKGEIALIINSLRFGLYAVTRTKLHGISATKVSDCLTLFWQYQFQTQLQSVKVRQQLHNWCRGKDVRQRGDNENGDKV
ncbi:MAG: hypothetical protein RUDDFDWM_001862 [Candidatus Fervidibacterota bacterium]